MKPDSARNFSSPTVSVTMRENLLGRAVFDKMPWAEPSMAMTFDKPMRPVFAAA
jgi:hypothetical protein